MIDTKRYDELAAQACDIKTQVLRDEVDGVIWSAYINANDTLRERAITEDEWHGCFVSSLEALIACGELSTRAKRWFSARGVKW